MHCTTCGKDSTNRRVCPHCFTPYPTVEDTVGDTRAVVMRLTPVMRWAGLGIAIVLSIWMFSGSDEPSAPNAAGSGATTAIAESPAMSRDEAVAHIKHTRETALVETQADEVFVSYSAATFPLRAEGQLALVHRFARADEVVEGRKRRIFFYNPNGRLFAQADPLKGITLEQ